jgi:hypothetical protein
MINLDISNYTGAYTYLNGQTTQNVRPFDLARAMVTIGQSSWSDVYRLGIFRIGELICKALAFSKLENGNLVLQDRFYNLNQSEMATISYYFGQAFTKLYAEENFGVKWLFHVDDYNKFIQFNTVGTTTPKIVVGNSKKAARRPDLIAIEKANTSHIFEAKGSSGGFNTSVMQHAINQVSQVRSYNGVQPITRTACYFDLSGTPIKGYIIDPENDDKGIDFQMSEESAIETYYSFFRENQNYFNTSFQFFGYQFLTIPVGVPNIFFGFDKRILEMNANELLNNDLYNEEQKLLKTIEGSQTISLGLDGLILFDKTDIAAIKNRTLLKA